MGQIRVISAVTTNGRDVLMRNGQLVFKSTIVEATAQPIFEKMNRHKPDILKYKFEPVGPAAPDEQSTKPVKPRTPKTKEDDTE